MGVRNRKTETIGRLNSKTLDARFLNEVQHGLNCSPFEGEAVLEVVKEIYSARRKTSIEGSSESRPTIGCSKRRCDCAERHIGRAGCRWWKSISPSTENWRDKVVEQSSSRYPSFGPDAKNLPLWAKPN